MMVRPLTAPGETLVTPADFVQHPLDFLAAVLDINSRSTGFSNGVQELCASLQDPDKVSSPVVSDGRVYTLVAGRTALGQKVMVERTVTVAASSEEAADRGLALHDVIALSDITHPAPYGDPVQRKLFTASVEHDPSSWSQEMSQDPATTLNEGLSSLFSATRLDGSTINNQLARSLVYAYFGS